MKRMLAIETSAEACSAALAVDGDVRERFEHAPLRHAELILPMISGLLAEAGLRAGDSRVDSPYPNICPTAAGGDLIVVGHFGMILTQVQRALQLDATQAFSHRIDNLSVTQLTRHKAGWDVGHINHLP